MKDGIILLVEDNPNDEALTLRALKKNNIQERVVVARDGAEALDYLFATGAHQGRSPGDLPRVVLLDLKLPKVDGLEVLRRLRANAHTRFIPVVILTSSNEDRVPGSATYGVAAGLGLVAGPPEHHVLDHRGPVEEELLRAIVLRQDLRQHVGREQCPAVVVDLGVDLEAGLVGLVRCDLEGMELAVGGAGVQHQGTLGLCQRELRIRLVAEKLVRCADGRRLRSLPHAL